MVPESHGCVARVLGFEPCTYIVCTGVYIQASDLVCTVVGMSVLDHLDRLMELVADRARADWSAAPLELLRDPELRPMWDDADLWVELFSARFGISPDASPYWKVERS